MTTDSTLPAREVWQIAGPEAVAFLQGLVSNDVLPLEKGRGLIWTALLTPQGKYLADFFLVRLAAEGEPVLFLDIDARLAPATLRLLQMYRLRSKVAITKVEMDIEIGTGAAPQGAFVDPRHPALGFRAYQPVAEDRTGALTSDATDWDALRVEHLIPAYPEELRVNESYLLEQGFERLHGVDFRKGCYVGQEVTARMKHKTELKKGLLRLHIEGHAEPGTPIALEDGREAGIIGTVSGDRALAYLRFDRLDQPLFAGQARLSAEAG